MTAGETPTHVDVFFRMEPGEPTSVLILGVHMPSMRTSAVLTPKGWHAVRADAERRIDLPADAWIPVQHLGLAPLSEGAHS